MGNLASSQDRYGRGQYYQDPYGSPIQGTIGPQQGPFGGPQSSPFGVPQQGPFIGPQQGPVDQQPHTNNPGFYGGQPLMAPLPPSYGQPPQAFEQQAYPPYPQQNYQGYPPQWGPQQGYPQQGYPQQGYQQGSGMGNAAGCAACMACLTCLLCSCCQGMMGGGMQGMDDMNSEHATTPVTAPHTDAIDADHN